MHKRIEMSGYSRKKIDLQSSCERANKACKTSTHSLMSHAGIKGLSSLLLMAYDYFAEDNTIV